MNPCYTALNLCSLCPIEHACPTGGINEQKHQAHWRNQCNLDACCMGHWLDGWHGWMTCVSRQYQQQNLLVGNHFSQWRNQYLDAYCMGHWLDGWHVYLVSANSRIFWLVITFSNDEISACMFCNPNPIPETLKKLQSMQHAGTPATLR